MGVGFFFSSPCKDQRAKRARDKTRALGFFFPWVLFYMRMHALCGGECFFFFFEVGRYNLYPAVFSRVLLYIP